MSCERITARSCAAPVTPTLNLRPSQLNSGWSVDHWRISSAVGRGSSTSSAAAPAKWSAVTLRMQLPLVWIACMSTSASASQDVGHVAELRPVELDVLPRGEVAVALVPALGDHRELPQLHRVQRAVGDGDAQHVGVQLQVEAVPQPERQELVLGQLAGDAPLDLVAELRHPLAHELPVEVGIVIHRNAPPGGHAGGSWKARGYGTSRGSARARRARGRRSPPRRGRRRPPGSGRRAPASAGRRPPPG